MAGVQILLLIGCLLQEALCGNPEVFLPKTVAALSGSCGTVPCSFQIKPSDEQHLTPRCFAVWKNREEEIYSSQNPRLTTTEDMTGDLTQRNCTTTFNRMRPEHSGIYYLRLDCDKLKMTFEKTVKVVVAAKPPSPTLSPSALEVNEGTPVSLTCSAPSPCESHPPTLTWTPGLGASAETLQENVDKTKVKISVLNFTASHLLNGRTISCTAVYKKQDGTADEAATVDLTASVLYSPKAPTVSVSPSGPLSENSVATLTCSSAANPAVTNYTWYTVDGNLPTFAGNGPTLVVKALEVRGPFVCTAENRLGVGRSNMTRINTRYSPQGTTVSVTPFGPVPEGSNVILACRCTASPPVRNYTWFQADGERETFVGAGRTLNLTAWRDSAAFLCVAENEIGVGRSHVTQIDVQFPPLILLSSNCSITTRELSCSCETVGKPLPALLWYLDGLPVIESGNLSVSSEPLSGGGGGGWRSVITVARPLQRELPALLCSSSNPLGSATRHFCARSDQNQAEGPIPPCFSMLLVLIIAVVTLLSLVYFLLVVIRVQKNKPNADGQHTSEINQVNDPLLDEEGNEKPDATEEDVSISTKEKRPTDAGSQRVAGCSSIVLIDVANGARGGAELQEAANGPSYSVLNWSTRRKKTKGNDSERVASVLSVLEREQGLAGDAHCHLLSSAIEMEIIQAEVEQRVVKKITADDVLSG